jgi:hypothetical protein
VLPTSAVRGRVRAGPFGVKSVGDLRISNRNAESQRVHDVVVVRIATAPMTVERVLSALETGRTRDTSVLQQA